MAKKKPSFWRHHSLSAVAGAILLLWIVLYLQSDPKTHLGAFYGNAIADWSGVVLMVLATKHLYERGSAESRTLPKTLLRPAREFLRDHSLSIFLIASGVVWAVVFARMDPGSKWGQVVGNLVSEWVQTLGLVLLTKKLFEWHSKESSR